MANPTAPSSYVMDEQLRGQDAKVGQELQRKNNFTIVFSPPGISPADAGVIQLSLHKAEVPKRTITEIGIDFGNEKYFVAGKPTHEDATITVKDIIGADTADAINNWCNLVYNPDTGVIGKASAYKTNAVLWMLSPDDEHNLGGTARSWLLKGIWPKSVNYGGGDMTATGDGAMNMIEITFKVDKVVYQGMGGGSQSASAGG